ncbi:MAG: hypothetical protein IIU55_04380 [Paludibacteraceae bacterium]|nr:hypothetical protein [Paludibacteraceae bacterium]
MKKIHFSLLMLAIVVICTSCVKEPQPMAYITSHLNVPITLYSEKDSVFLAPMQRTYLCDVEVENGKFIHCGGINWVFSVFEPIVKIGLLDTIYAVPEQYQKFLADVDSYMYHLSYSSTSSSSVKYESSNYDYYLKADFVEDIIEASVVNK